MTMHRKHQQQGMPMYRRHMIRSMPNRSCHPCRMESPRHPGGAIRARRRSDCLGRIDRIRRINTSPYNASARRQVSTDSNGRMVNTRSSALWKHLHRADLPPTGIPRKLGSVRGRFYGSMRRTYLAVLAFRRFLPDLPGLLRVWPRLLMHYTSVSLFGTHQP